MNRTVTRIVLPLFGMSRTATSATSQPDDIHCGGGGPIVFAHTQTLYVVPRGISLAQEQTFRSVIAKINHDFFENPEWEGDDRYIPFDFIGLSLSNREIETVFDEVEVFLYREGYDLFRQYLGGKEWLVGIVRMPSVLIV